MTAKDVLAHPWIAGKTAPSKAFDSSHSSRLKLLQARRKLKRTVRTIMAVNKFKFALNSLIDEEYGTKVKIEPVKTTTKPKDKGSK